MALQCENCELVVDNRQLSSSVHEVAPSHCPQCGQYVIWIEQGPEVAESQASVRRASIVQRVRKLFAM